MAIPPLSTPPVARPASRTALPTVATSSAAPPPTAGAVDAFEPMSGDAAVPSWDVATITPQELARLQGGSAADKRTAVSIQYARYNLKGLLAAGTRIVVTQSAGNGGQPVLLAIPKGFDASKPARVHTHFHGWGATVADPMNHSSGTHTRLAARQKADPQTLFVLPECGNAPVRTGLWGPSPTDWSNVSDIAQTARDALAAGGLGGITVSERVVSAHSGGGRALGYALAAHPDGSGLQADRLELQDCLYGAPAGTVSARQAVERWAATPNGAACREVVYLHGTGGNGDLPSTTFLSAWRGRYRRIEVASHDGTVSKWMDGPFPAVR